MKYIISIILTLIIFSACHDTLEIPDYGRKIVINGLVTNDSLLSVRVGTSAYILNNDGYTTEQQMDLKEADVKIFLNGNNIDSLSHIYTYNDRYDTYEWSKIFFRGNYRSQKLIAKERNEYLITISASGFPEATAHTKIPDVVKIESIDTTHVIMPPGEYVSLNTGLGCKIRFTDPPDVANFYLLTVGKVPGYYYDNCIEINSKDPVIEETLHTRDSGVEGIAFSDRVIDGQEYTLSIILRNESISRVLSHSLDGKFSLSFRLYSIPEEYFIYIKTLNQYEKNLGNPLADPVMMYSNVTGGFGMFAGAAVSSVSINYSLNDF